MTWNPSGPGQAGFEWPVTRQGGVSLSSAGVRGGALVGSTVAETVSKVWAHLGLVDGEGVRVRAEVWAANSLPPTTTVNTYRPSADVLTAYWTGTPDDVDLFTNINEVVLDTESYVRTETQARAYRCNVGSGGFTLGVNERIDRVVLHSAFTGSGSPRISIEGESAYANEPHQEVVTYITDPATGVEWTQAAVRAFASSRYLSAINSQSTASMTVYQMWLEVVSEQVADESAEAFVEPGWNGFDVGSWSKTSGTDYVVLLQLAATSGRAVWSTLDSGTPPPEGGRRVPIVVDADGRIVSVGGVLTESPALTFERSDAALSVDSQPYALLERLPVYAGNNVTETVSLDGAARRNVRVVVARQSSATVEPLTVAIGGTQGTVEVADVADAVRKLREVTVVLDDTITPSGNTVITLSCPAPDGQGWEVVRLSTAGQHTSAAYGNGTDVPVLVTGAPAAVGGVTAT